MSIPVNGNGVKGVLNQNVTKILTILAGAAVLGLQGINLSEVAQGNAQGAQRMDVLQQLLQISKDQTRILENGEKLIESGTKTLENDEASIKNQTEILTTLKAAIAERREALKPSPTPDK